MVNILKSIKKIPSLFFFKQGGADPTMKGVTGRIPLHEACIGGHSDVVALLLDHMTTLEIADKNKHTAAHHSAYNGEGKCIKLLAAKGKWLEN